jgi:hypothetical protein
MSDKVNAIANNGECLNKAVINNTKRNDEKQFMYLGIGIVQS